MGGSEDNTSVLDSIIKIKCDYTACTFTHHTFHFIIPSCISTNVFTINKPNQVLKFSFIVDIVLRKESKIVSIFFFWNSHPESDTFIIKLTLLSFFTSKLITKFTLPAGVNLIALLTHYLKFEPICFHLLQRALGHHLKSKIENQSFVFRLYLRIIFKLSNTFNGLNCVFPTWVLFFNFGEI
jgi:hypothetical protein